MQVLASRSPMSARSPRDQEARAYIECFLVDCSLSTVYSAKLPALQSSLTKEFPP